VTYFWICVDLSGAVQDHVKQPLADELDMLKHRHYYDTLLETHRQVADESPGSGAGRE
jgi:hypothetical protein